MSSPPSEADLDRRASDLIDAMLAFRWACDAMDGVSGRGLGDVCDEAADLVTFCLARGASVGDQWVGPGRVEA